MAFGHCPFYIHGMSSGRTASMLRHALTSFGSPWRGLIAELGLIKLNKTLPLFHGATFNKAEGLFKGFLKSGAVRASGKRYTFGPGVYFTQKMESALTHVRSTASQIARAGSLIEKEQRVLSLHLPKKTQIFNLGRGQSSKEFGALLESAFEKRFGTKVPFSGLTRGMTKFEDAASVYNEARVSLEGLFERFGSERATMGGPIRNVLDTMAGMASEKGWADRLINDTLRSAGVQGIAYEATHTPIGGMELMTFNERMFDKQLTAGHIRKKVVTDTIKATGMTHGAQPQGTPVGIAKSILGDRGSRQMPRGGNG